MSIQPLYPSVLELIDLSKIPSQLDFVGNSIEDLFGRIHYKDLIVNVSPTGDSGSYSLTVVAYDKLGLNIPGTGVSILINPGPQTAGISTTEVPMFVNYRWGILKYKDSFSSLSLTGGIDQILELLLEVAEITKEELIEEAINAFFEAQDSLQHFVDTLNSTLTLANTLTVNLSLSTFGETLTDLIQQLETEGVDVVQMIYDLVVYPSGITFDEAFDNLKALLFKWFGELTQNATKQLLNLEVQAGIYNIDLALEFPRTFLRPIYTGAVDYPDVDQQTFAIGDELPEPYRSRVSFNAGSITWGSEEGFVFDALGTFSFAKSTIGKTGIALDINSLKLDLSRETNIPEATADGRPDDFVGVFIESCDVELPAFWNHDPNDANNTALIKGQNLIIGTGGISGRISMEMLPGETEAIIGAKWGNFEVELLSFDLEFQQNTIINPNIRGRMLIPKLKVEENGTMVPAWIDIAVSIGQDGDFSVTLSNEIGITALEIEDLLKIKIKSLEVGNEDDRFYIEVTGVLDFSEYPGGSDPQANNSFLNNVLPKDIEIEKLRIWDDGKMEFEGGTINLRKPITIDVKPVKVTITALCMGKHERMHPNADTDIEEMREYMFVGFDAGVAVDPGGVDARGDGIKLYFTVDNNPSIGKKFNIYLRIASIGIDIIIPGDAEPEDAELILSGYLAMREPSSGNPADGTEYMGGIDFALPQLKMGGSAAMRFNPKIPAWMVDVGMELPTPIPLGSTGLGIYGFRALLGLKYTTSKTAPAVGLNEEDPWWMYYKKKVSPDYKEGITVPKFEQEDGFSLGAGVSLATTPDDGQAFSSKIFFLMSLPGVFLLQGQGQIMKERIGLDTTTDPPFFVLIAITDQSIEAAFGAHILIPDSGDDAGSTAVIDGIVEMGYFWGDSGAWYVNYGKEFPENQRILARLFDLIDAYYFMMISSSGISAGAGASMEVSKEFGPLSATLIGYLDVRARLGFKPAQLGGSIQMGSEISLSIFGLGVSVSTAASLAAEVPKPFIITGSLEACIRVLGEDRCAKFEFTWIRDTSLDLTELPMIDPQAVEEAAKAINIQTKEQFPLNSYTTQTVVLPTAIPTPTSGSWSASFDDRVIPMDSFIDIEFKNGVKPTGNFGGVTTAANYVEYVSPKKAKSDRVRHEFVADDITVYAWNGTNSSWEEYDIVGALTPSGGGAFDPPANMKAGYWQMRKPGRYNQLRLMSQTPLSFLTQGYGTSASEEFGITSSTLFCVDEEIAPHCIKFMDYGPTGSAIAGETLNFIDPILFEVVEDTTVENEPLLGIDDAVILSSENSMDIYLTDSATNIDLTIKTEATEAKVYFYRRSEIDQGTGYEGLPEFEYELITGGGITNPITVTSSTTVVNWAHQTELVDRIEITGTFCEPAPISCGTIASEGTALLGFLNALESNNHLHSSSVVLNATTYNNVYHNTVLYPTVSIGNDVTFSSAINSAGDRLEMMVYDEQGDFRNINLELPSALSGFNFSNITGFSNFQLISGEEVQGDNYRFSVDVSLSGGGGRGGGPSTATLHGDCPWVVASCAEQSCNTFVYQICYNTLEEILYNSSIPGSTEVTADNDAMLDGLDQTVNPIWRPNTIYCVKIETSDNMYRNNSQNILDSQKRTVCYGFRTAGPLGHFHKYQFDFGASPTVFDQPTYGELEAGDRQDEFKLTGLNHYINFERSYPNASGNLINAKPLFYENPKLLLFFKQQYMHTMFRGWEAIHGADAISIDLEALILDPAEPALDPATGNPPLPNQVSASWDSHQTGGLSGDVNLINNLITNADFCTGCICNQAITTVAPPMLHSSFQIGNLKPLKLYSALFNAKYTVASNDTISREVHKYGFQTSRYASFADQVNSYLLLDETETGGSGMVKEAIFYETRVYPLAQAKAVLDGTMSASDTLIRDCADSFERLVDRVLGLGDLHPPISTEFNVLVRNNRVFGILVRNPEPFNDPSLPESDLADTLTLSIDGAPTTDNFVWYSKDRSEMFVTNTVLNGDMPTGTYSFAFKYKEYDGDQYQVAESVDVDIDVTI